MSTHALRGPEIPLLLDPDERARLQKLADAADRSISELVGAVLRDFLDENERQLVAIDAGIAEADAGELIDYDDIKAEIQTKLAALSAKR